MKEAYGVVRSLVAIRHAPYQARRCGRSAPRPLRSWACVAALGTLLCTTGAASGAGEAYALSAPTITPDGGAFIDPQTVTISRPPSSVLVTISGWRTGVKHPGKRIEEATALSDDGHTVTAVRALTNTDDMNRYPGVNFSPDHGNGPFYIWSLKDVTGGYEPSMFAGATDAIEWDGANGDFYAGETGNRVFLLLRQWANKEGSGGGISLWSCAAGKNQDRASQELAQFSRVPMRTYADQPVRLEFADNKVRVRVGERPLICATTDTAGWVTYTGDDGSGRVSAALGATRFWFTLAGGEFKGSRELIVSESPPPVIRFTTDDSEVTHDSPILDHPLIVTHSVTIRARCFRGDEPCSREASAFFRSDSPLLPDESYVSPIRVTIPHAPLDGTPAQVSIDGPSGVVHGLDTGNRRFVLRYPLAPEGATALVLRRNGLADHKQKVAWRPVAITPNADRKRVAIRRGETMLLTARAPREKPFRIDLVEGTNQPYRSLTGKGGEVLPVLFDRAGVITAQASIDGVPGGSLAVTVGLVDFKGPLACQVKFTRIKDVAIHGPAEGIFFTSSDPDTLRVRVKEPTSDGVRLELSALQYGKASLQVRIGGPSGAVIAEHPVDIFTLELCSSHGLLDANKPAGVPMGIELRPYLPYLRIDFSMRATFSTFDDNARAFSVNTSDSKTSIGRPGFQSRHDAATGEQIGVFDFAVEVPPGECGWAFGSGVTVTERAFPYIRVGGM